MAQGTWYFIQLPSQGETTCCIISTKMLPSPLIATKLHIPQPHPDSILRPKLFELLEQGLTVPLILVSAPPGFGKSMLLAGWIHSRPTGLQTAWLSLDDNDNEPGFIWQYLIAALQNLYGQIGKTAQEMLAAAAPPDMQSILATLINEMTGLNSPLLIVLDDYHLIKSPTIHEQVRFLLDHLPPNVHLAILTREDPPLGLARRRARRQMVEIRAVNLRFNLSETAEFLNNIRRLALNPDQVQALEQHTEGWIAGLQMAALSLQGRDPGEFFEPFTGGNRYIVDYLVEEVLQYQDETVRTFLLKTSCLERLSAPLCAAVTGEPNSRELLDILERANLFLIPLDNHREFFRYHHLFADLLRQRLHESYPEEEIASLHRKSSYWFETHGDIPAAVRYARQIPDEPLAQSLLQRYAGTFFQHGALPLLCDLASTIPPDQRQMTPILCCAVAWASLASNRFDVVDDWLKTIERHFGQPAIAALEETSNPNSRPALLEVLVIRLQLPGYSKTSDHILSIQRLLNTLPPEQPCLFNTVANLKPVIAFNLGLLSEESNTTSLANTAFSDTLSLAKAQQNWHLYHLARGHLANLQTAMGHLNLARDTFEQGLSEDSGANVSPYRSILHAGLGMLHYEWNNLPEAEIYFEKGLVYARLWNQWESLVPLTIGMARLKWRTGDLKQAFLILDQLQKPPIDHLALSLEIFTALLRTMNGIPTPLPERLAAKITYSSLDPNAFYESTLLDYAHLLVIQQHHTEAATLLAEVCEKSLSSGRIYTLIRARVTQVRLYANQGKTKEALETLHHALPLAAPEGYISTFVDHGETIRILLREVHSNLSSGELRNYVDQVLAAFSPGKEHSDKEYATGHRLPELSERELEILALVAAGLSNQEIAHQLVISITTVKTHIGNIFNKLGVTSRIQAIARAEAAGLLPRR